MKVNGKPFEPFESFESATPPSLLEVVEFFGLNPQAVAIERNGKMEPRDSWAVTRTSTDDSIELIRFVGGG